MDTLHISIRLHLFLTGAAARLRQVGSNEEGQTAAEYLGVIVALAALVTGLAFTDVGRAIKDAIILAVQNILSAG
jgi:hypothetical protein